jgi:hypothetical protein
MAPVTFDGPNRSASAFWYWATRRIPHKSNKLYFPDKIEPFIEDVRPSPLQATALAAQMHAHACRRISAATACC